MRTARRRGCTGVGKHHRRPCRYGSTTKGETNMWKLTLGAAVAVGMGCVQLCRDRRAGTRRWRLVAGTSRDLQPLLHRRRPRVLDGSRQYQPRGRGLRAADARRGGREAPHLRVLPPPRGLLLGRRGLRDHRGRLAPRSEDLADRSRRLRQAGEAALPGRGLHRQRRRDSRAFGDFRRRQHQAGQRAARQGHRGCRPDQRDQHRGRCQVAGELLQHGPDRL